jgi:hypothetical protein
MMLRRQQMSKIEAISRLGFGSTAFPVYRCGAAGRQAVGPLRAPSASDKPGVVYFHLILGTTVNLLEPLCVAD